jgi:hypothetical protein
MLGAKRPFALCAKLTLGNPAGAQGEMHVIGYVSHAQAAIPSPNKWLDNRPHD